MVRRTTDSIHRDNKGLPGFNVTATYNRPKYFEVELPDLKAKVKGGSGFREHIPSIASLEWEHSSHITLEFEAPQGVRYLLEKSYHCQNLLSILVGSPVAPKEITFVKGRGDHAEVHYLGVFRMKSFEEHIHPLQMLLPASRLKDQMPRVVERWFTSNECKHAIDIFFGVLYSPPSALELRFLSLTQALESFHRGTASGFYMERAEYAAAIKKVVAAIPAEIQGDHRTSLKNRLKYGNEYSLRKRINQLMASLPENVRNVLLAGAEDFVNRVVLTRNYLTHFDDECEQGTYKDIALYHAAERLRVFLLALFLDRLGIDGETVADAFQRRPDIVWVLEQQL